MTSEKKNATEGNAMEKLSDLRVVFAGDKLAQDRLLQIQFPPTYNPVASSAIPHDEKVDSSGLEALIIVIRRLISHVAEKYRDSSSDPEIAQQEQENPLLHLAMCNFRKASEGDVIAAGYLALKAFQGGEKLRRKDLTFSALSEHRLMHRTLWKRAPFLLFAVEQEVRDSSSAEWEPCVEENPSELAEHSLTHYSTGDLGRIISARFDRFHDQTDDHEVILQSNRPLPEVLRVRYDVDKNDPKTYKDLRRIVVDMARLGQRPGTMTTSGSFLTHYSLIAIVCLSNGKAKDTVRTYTLDGQAITTPEDLPSAYLGNLGQPGASYVLYYGRCSSYDPGRKFAAPEIPWVPSRALVERVYGDLLAPEPQESPGPPSSPSASEPQLRRASSGREYRVFTRPTQGDVPDDRRISNASDRIPNVYRQRDRDRGDEGASRSRTPERRASGSQAGTTYLGRTIVGTARPPVQEAVLHEPRFAPPRNSLLNPPHRPSHPHRRVADRSGRGKGNQK
ncbi:uncharacterized protein F4807DRAFT_462715 [Annulohypoxylon truncatum]|uniref:uncharacterized protein n=1 Tax=Annulohypoxylon truncatum TaxID=327061 RepID=UPI00200841E9|nr:uncharacterized protein F4807DRAFT_462715 [Annulohypoxylon truncatum]KAI1207561.1 hypothetical protein F4807DRAFT_462715 [Annulohypoxylon truncatum]